MDKCVLSETHRNATAKPFLSAVLRQLDCIECQSDDSDFLVKIVLWRIEHARKMVFNDRTNTTDTITIEITLYLQIFR